MKVVYVSYDGKHFASEEECRYHEENNPTFKMYDEDGMVTDNPIEAEVVHLFDDVESGRDCANLYEEYGCDCEGIDEYSCAGWYFWDAGWNRIPGDIISVLKKVLQ